MMGELYLKMVKKFKRELNYNLSIKETIIEYYNKRPKNILIK